MIQKDSTWLGYAIRIPSVLLIIIWGVKIYEIINQTSLADWGILPRNFEGLRGVFFMPFIHGDIAHAAHNSIPLFVLAGILIYFYRKTSWFILVVGTLLTGLITWLIANKAYHIGASGVIYMLASYIFFGGVFRRSVKLMALSLLVSFLYGSMVWGIFPFEYTVQERISWEGHLAGTVVGLFMAYRFRKVQIESPQKYSWEVEQELEEEDQYWMVEEEPQEKKVPFKDLF
ncbi:MAG: rhomboid family intramembrane serine protease [Flavobacteriales bacterium]